MTTSTIFINEPTVVDHSYIDPEGRIVGGSVNPSFEITGAVLADENVVVDFSTGKNQIKKLIDDPDNGFDHKCWVVIGYSAVVSIIDVMTKEKILKPEYLCSGEDPDRVISVTTKQIQIRAPKSAFRFVEPIAASGIPYNSIQFLNKAITSSMKSWLEANMPGMSITVKLHANPVPSKVQAHQLFRYVHGLKDSTSWGCQNIAHGHLSFVDIECGSVDENSKKNVLTSIANDLDNTIFINVANYSEAISSRDISYQSQNRGRFEMTLMNTAQQKFVVMETETTIEHIIEYVAARFQTQLKSIRTKRLYVSEGLSKGAVIDIDPEE